MAELGVLASVTGVLQFVILAIEIGKDMKQADDDRKVLLAGLSSLKFMAEVLLHRLEDASAEERWHRYVRKMQETSGTLEFDECSVTYKPPPEPKGPLADFYRSVERMSTKLNPPHAAHDFKHADFCRRLLWKWKKVDYEHMLTDIGRAQGQISFILDQDEYELLKSIKSDAAETNSVVREMKQSGNAERDRRDKKDIEKWLSPLDFWEEKQLWEDSFPSGQKLVESFEFKQWSQGRSWHLRCYGKAGSGKTVLSSIIANHLKQDSIIPNSAVVCLFFSWSDPQRQVLEHLLGSLLKQLIQQRRSSPISAELKDEWQIATAEEAKARPAQIMKHLKAQLQRTGRVYLLLDAWDECAPEVQDKMEESLNMLEAENLSLLFTSRPVDDGLPVGKQVTCNVCLEPGLKIYFHCNICDNGGFDVCWNCSQKTPACKDASHELIEYGNIFVDVDTPRDVLEQYVRFQLQKESGKGSKLHDKRLNARGRGATRLGTYLQNEPELLESITRAAGEKAEGCFLHAKLFVDALKGMSRKQIDNALESFPINLDDVYKDAIERIQRMNKYERELGFMVLSLLACARRPLTLLELQGALGVMSRLSHQYDEEDWIYEKDEILKSTAGLIDIDNHERAVRLSHGSIRDSFVRNGVGGKHFLEAEVDVAIACVTYLNNDAFSERCSSAVEFETRRDTYPFIAYASQHWGHHVQKAIDDPQLKSAAVRLLQNPRRVDAFMQAQWLTDDSSGSWDVRKGVHGLHICAKFGLYPLIPALVQKGDDVNVKEEQYGQTPLMYACRDGYIETIQKLLDLDAEVNIISKRGRTALFEAIINYHVEVVNVLLTRRERDIEINASIGGQGERPTRTALLLAVELGRRDIALRLLQQHGINVDQKDSRGYTALSIAAITGQTEMVQDLLGIGKIEVDHVDEYGRSALYFAAERGYTDIVRDLLQKHANPDLPDSDGNTALMQAVDQEHIDLVESMLGHHPNLQWRNSNGCYLLHLISEKDWPELVRTLVKQGADPNKTDNDGLTPLHYAARSGRDEVVKVLLEEGADSAKEDSSGMTPEQFAAAYGCTEVVKTLRGSDAVPEERTPPIWRLAKEGRIDLIKSAIEASKEDLSETEPVTENTALHCAVQNDQVEIVRMLLEDGRMDPNARNRDLCTPLLFAAELEDLAVIEELLKRHADPDLADRYGNTPLYLASQRPCKPVPIALVEGGAEIDPQKVVVQDLFFKAVELGKSKATEILLHSGADSWEKNHLGKNAHQVAKEGGNNHLIQLLNSRTWSQKPEAWGTADMSKQADGQLASPLAEMVTKDHVFLPFRAVENLAFDESVPSLDIDKSLFLAEDSRPEDVPRTNRAAAEQHPDDPSSVWWPEAPKRDPSGKGLGKNPRTRMLA